MSISLYAQAPVRPIIQVPDSFTTIHWQQEAVIQYANFLQQVNMANMNEYCTKNQGTLQKTRNERDQVIFVCIPNQEKDK